MGNWFGALELKIIGPSLNTGSFSLTNVCYLMYKLSIPFVCISCLCVEVKSGKVIYMRWGTGVQECENISSLYMHAIIFQLLYVFQYNFLWKNYRHIYIEVQGIWMTNINSWPAGFNKGFTLRLPYTFSKWCSLSGSNCRYLNPISN